MESSATKILTVSVAAYNVEQFLSSTLDSCLIGDDTGLEVIVVNDGSTDGSLDIALDYQKRSPDLFKVIDKENGGYGSTINASLAIASGKYFRYLDGDDWFDATRLRQYLHLLADCKADAVFTPYRRVFENGDDPVTVDDLSHMDEGLSSFSQVVCDDEIAACALAYKTNLLREIGFKMSEHCFYTDVEYSCLPISHVSSLYVYKQPLYLYRIGREGQSVSIQSLRRHYHDSVKVCMRLLGEIPFDDEATSPYLIRAVAHECCMTVGHLCLAGPGRNVKKELIEFDSYIKNASLDVYKAMASISKRVRLLRDSHYALWMPISKISSWRSK